MSDYVEYRRDQPGPLSVKTFQFWKNNGGEDLPTFKWTNKKVKKQKQKNGKNNHHKNNKKNTIQINKTKKNIKFIKMK